MSRANVEVSKHVRALDATSFDGYDHAYHSLRRGLVASGRWSAANVAAIVALTKLVSPKSRELRRILVLIADLAAGDHRFLIAGGEARNRSARTSAQLAALVVRPAVLGLLTSKKAELRSVALFFLAIVATADNNELTARVFETAVSDRSKEVRSSAALWLGLEDRRGNQAARKSLAKLADDDDLVRGATWIAREIAGKRAPIAGAAIAAAGWVGSTADSAALPWGDDVAWEFVIDDAIQDPDRRAALAAPFVRAAAERFGAQAKNRANIADTALRLCGLRDAYAEEHVAEFRELTPAQRATARALLAFPDVAGGLGHGIPFHVATTRRWLGVDPPTPLEQPSSKGTPPRWRRLREMIGKESKQSILRAATEGLEPAERLTVLQALVDGAYGILSAAELRIDPKELSRAATASKEGGVNWAKQSLASATPGYRTPELLSAMTVLVRAGEPFDPAWDDLVGFLPTDLAREVLAAIPRARRAALALRWATGLKGGQATFLKSLAPLYDLLGSPALGKAVRPWLKLGTVKNIVGLVDLVRPLLDVSDHG